MSVVTNYAPYRAYTLPEEISAGKNINMSHGNMQFKVRVGDTITPYETIFTRYHNVLKNYIVTRTLTEEEFSKYYQQPKLLSYDIYGTPELWSGLLYINNMVSVANFTKRTIKLFSINIMDILQEVMTIYNNDLNNNKTEVYKDL